MLEPSASAPMIAVRFALFSTLAKFLTSCAIIGLQEVVLVNRCCRVTIFIQDASGASVAGYDGDCARCDDADNKN
jgi:hypothetical protein